MAIEGYVARRIGSVSLDMVNVRMVMCSWLVLSALLAVCSALFSQTDPVCLTAQMMDQRHRIPLWVKGDKQSSVLSFHTSRNEAGSHLARIAKQGGSSASSSTVRLAQGEPNSETGILQSSTYSEWRMANGHSPSSGTGDQTGIVVPVAEPVEAKKNAKALASKDILLVCGWDDQVVSIDRYILPLYRELQKENAAQVRIVAFQDDHGFSDSRDRIAEVIRDWIKIILNK